MSDRRAWLSEWCPRCPAPPDAGAVDGRAAANTILRCPSTWLVAGERGRARPARQRRVSTAVRPQVARRHARTPPGSAPESGRFSRARRSGMSWSGAGRPPLRSRSQEKRVGEAASRRSRSIASTVRSPSRLSGGIETSLPTPWKARCGIASVGSQGSRPWRGTVRWTVPDRLVVIAGRRGDQTFEEVVR
jgi:hypothetical protein